MHPPVRTLPGAFRTPLTLVLLCLPFLLAPEAQALRLVNYNILNYPGSTGPARAPYYQTILDPLGADVIVTEEISNAAGPTEFLNEVLQVLEPGEWATVPFIDGNDTDSSLFYKPSKLEFLGQWAFYPNPANHLRLVHVYRLKPVGYSSQAAEIRVYSCHLKASTGSESQRLAECIGIRDSMNVMPEGTHAVLCGDLNFYTQASEPGYTRLTESEADNTGRLFDMLPAGAWHDGAAYAPYHTQSTCLSGTCAPGAATGGMDDRFDFVLPTYSLTTGQGFSAIPYTCVAVGNDGLHLNKNITDAPIIPEGAAYANALKLASDHLPVRLDLQLPARMAMDSVLAFGIVIEGAPGQELPLFITNPATPPADSLNCVFTPPSGFSAPARLAVAAGASGSALITMDTATPGPRSGALSVVSDAPDDPLSLVQLSGSVLRHAVASLDSEAVETSGVLDFGSHEPGGFSVRPILVHNLGYDGGQARLLVSDAVITGGGGRFSFPDGFEPRLIERNGEFTVRFDDAGAELDSTYSATLVFTSSDEPLPGAAAQPELTVALSAHVSGGPGAAPATPLPLATRMYDPFPNPSQGGTTIALDLASPLQGSLAVFDAAGRRVTILRQGVLPAGRMLVSWDGRGENGERAGSGIYLIRFSAAGLASRTARVAILR